jgi:hypothetical protein
MLRNPWALGEGGQNQFLWNGSRSPGGLPTTRDRCFGEGGAFRMGGSGGASAPVGVLDRQRQLRYPEFSFEG